MRVSMPNGAHLAGGGHEIEGRTQMLLGDRLGQINLVAKNQKRHVPQLLNRQQPLASPMLSVRDDERTFSSCLDSSKRPGSAASTINTIPEQSG